MIPNQLLGSCERILESQWISHLFQFGYPPTELYLSFISQSEFLSFLRLLPDFSEKHPYRNPGIASGVEFRGRPVTVIIDNPN